MKSKIKSVFNLRRSIIETINNSEIEGEGDEGGREGGGNYLSNFKRNSHINERKI